MARTRLGVEPLEARQLLAVDFVVHISVDGLGGPYLEPLVAGEATSAAGEYSNFLRLQNEGAFTYNARTDVTHTFTLPNHTTMLTGRPVLAPEGSAPTVSHNWTKNTDPANGENLHNNHPDVGYIASVFDVVHDAGLTTALYATKTKFSLYADSYGEQHGAPDTNGADNGTNKFSTGRISTNIDLVMEDLINSLEFSPANYTFFHSYLPDSAGHGGGWGSATWESAVQLADDHLGQILDTIESSSELNGRTAIILTSDHGGIGTGHADPSNAANYTIPFFVWGPDFQAATDLYSLYPETTADPGTEQPSYNAEKQPIRNGDSSNLALNLLDLPNIPGSTMDNLTTCEGDECDRPVDPPPPDPPNPEDLPPIVSEVIVNGNADTPNRLDSIEFTFSRDVSASLNTSDLTLANNATSQTILLPQSAKVMGRAEWRFSSVNLPPAYYRVILSGNGVFTADNERLDGNGDGVGGDSWQGQFLVAMAGDANADGVVDTQDYSILHSAPDTGTWRDGDFNGSGTIDDSDLSIWQASRFTDLRPARQPNNRSPRSAASQANPLDVTREQKRRQHRVLQRGRRVH